MNVNTEIQNIENMNTQNVNTEIQNIENMKYDKNNYSKEFLIEIGTEYLKEKSLMN